MKTSFFSTLHAITASDRPAREQDQLDTWRPPHPRRRALVLGGGGSVGNAWLIGVVAGLFDAGVDVVNADLTIGTSAGSTAAAQCSGASPLHLFEQILAASPPQRIGPGPMNGGRGTPATVADHLRRTTEIISAAGDPADMRLRLGAAALELAEASDGSRQEQWRATVAARLPDLQWPQRSVVITAVDASTGQPVVFDRHSGVDLVDAVAASTSSGASYRIGGSHYIDGGYRRSSENADLADGFGRVLVLSPLGGRSRAALAWGMHLSVQVDELRAGGSRVATVLPDSNSLAAFGSNLMNLAARAPAAQAGFAQGRGSAEQISGLWR